MTDSEYRPMGPNEFRPVEEKPKMAAYLRPEVVQAAATLEASGLHDAAKGAMQAETRKAGVEWADQAKGITREELDSADNLQVAGSRLNTTHLNSLLSHPEEWNPGIFSDIRELVAIQRKESESVLETLDRLIAAMESEAKSE